MTETPVAHVPERARERLARANDLPFGLFPAEASLHDGAIVRLESRRLGPLAVALVDRTAEQWRILVRADEPFAAPDAAWADARLGAATALRRDLGLLGPDDACRIANAGGDHLPGLTVDRYGAYGVVSAHTPALVEVAGLVARRLVARGDVVGVVLKLRERGAAGRGPHVVEVLGAPPPERHTVSEGAWRFEVHLTTGVNVGLFTDMRAERARIAALARDRRVLNLFAYTGAFSVAAASGGAAHVTSVDLSEGVLAWARDNYALNGLPAEVHTTVADDARRYLARAAEAGAQFDLVLVDPPSYSAARDGAFAIDRDYAALVAEACGLLTPSGDLWLASNARGFSLIGATQLALATAGRRASLVALGGLPPDYPTEPADADARYLQTCLLRLG